MEELTARRRADELGGIAIHATWVAAVGSWVLTEDPFATRATWIVVSRNRQELLDDGGAHEGSRTIEGYLDFEGRRIPCPLAIPDCSMDREAKLEDHLYVSHWPEDMARRLVELTTENEKLRQNQGRIRQQALQEAQTALSCVEWPQWHLETVHEATRRLEALQGLPESKEESE